MSNFAPTNTAVMKDNAIFHILAFLIVCVWGTTYVSSKVLINAGLSPAQIFTLRFAIAYLLLLAIYHRRLFADNWKDELQLALLGVTGGSMYFLSENTALSYSTASNVSLIVCSCPMVSMLMLAALYKEERLQRIQYAGSVLALVGMAVVVLNGHFVLHLSPLGDALALCACLCWSIYSVILRNIGKKYSSKLISRKVFFYGLLTITPYYIIYPQWPPIELLATPEVIAHLLFLAVVASFGAYLLWNICVDHLGVVIANNWIYLTPIATIVVAWLLIGEKPTPWLFIGTAMILIGMWLAAKRQ